MNIFYTRRTNDKLHRCLYMWLYNFYVIISLLFIYVGDTFQIGNQSYFSIYGI